MPPSPQPEPRDPTPRERRIQAQRELIAERRRARRSRLLWIAFVIVVLLVLVAAAVLFFLHPPVAAGGHSVALEASPLIAPGTSATYTRDPPSSGPHYASPVPYGVSERSWPPAAWLENLAQGGVVVLYDCSTACPTTVQELSQVYRSAPPSPLTPGRAKMVIEPYPHLKAPVTVLAWGWEDDLNAPDAARILAFYRAHLDRGPLGARL